MNQYELLQVIGEGTYGVVMKCRHKETGQIVAIKRFKMGETNEYIRRTMLRELRVEQLLKGEPHVVQLLEAFREKERLHLVMEFVESNLLDVLDDHPEGVSFEALRVLMYTLLQGVRSCHANGIIHRDIKPENVLVKQNGSATLCDFGFARPMSMNGVVGSRSVSPTSRQTTSTITAMSTSGKCDGPLPDSAAAGPGRRRSSAAGPPGTSVPLALDGASFGCKTGDMTDYVATRWYRSPEMLLGMPRYDFAVDMWAVGAIMAEIADGQPLLPGKTELEQLSLVQMRLGEFPPEYETLVRKRCGGVLRLLSSSSMNSNPLRGPAASVSSPTARSAKDANGDEGSSSSSSSPKERPSPYLERRFHKLLGKDGVHLLARLLAVDANERITVDDALEHCFFAGLAERFERRQSRTSPVSHSVNGETSEGASAEASNLPSARSEVEVEGSGGKLNTDSTAEVPGLGPQEEVEEDEAGAEEDSNEDNLEEEEEGEESMEESAATSDTGSSHTTRSACKSEKGGEVNTLATDPPLGVCNPPAKIPSTGTGITNANANTAVMSITGGNGAAAVAVGGTRWTSATAVLEASTSSGPPEADKTSVHFSKACEPISDECGGSPTTPLGPAEIRAILPDDSSDPAVIVAAQRNTLRQQQQQQHSVSTAVEAVLPTVGCVVETEVDNTGPDCDTESHRQRSSSPSPAAVHPVAFTCGNATSRDSASVSATGTAAGGATVAAGAAGGGSATTTTTTSGGMVDRRSSSVPQSNNTTFASSYTAAVGGSTVPRPSKPTADPLAMISTGSASNSTTASPVAAAAVRGGTATSSPKQQHQQQHQVQPSSQDQFQNTVPANSARPPPPERTPLSQPSPSRVVRMAATKSQSKRDEVSKLSALAKNNPYTRCSPSHGTAAAAAASGSGRTRKKSTGSTTTTKSQQKSLATSGNPTSTAKSSAHARRSSDSGRQGARLVPPPAPSAVDLSTSSGAVTTPTKRKKQPKSTPSAAAAAPPPPRVPSLSTRKSTSIKTQTFKAPSKEEKPMLLREIESLCYVVAPPSSREVLLPFSEEGSARGAETRATREKTASASASNTTPTTSAMDTVVPLIGGDKLGVLPAAKKARRSSGSSSTRAKHSKKPRVPSASASRRQNASRRRSVTASTTSDEKPKRTGSIGVSQTVDDDSSDTMVRVPSSTTGTSLDVESLSGTTGLSSKPKPDTKTNGGGGGGDEATHRPSLFFRAKRTCSPLKVAALTEGTAGTGLLGGNGVNGATVATNGGGSGGVGGGAAAGAGAAGGGAIPLFGFPRMYHSPLFLQPSGVGTDNAASSRPVPPLVRHSVHASQHATAGYRATPPSASSLQPLRSSPSASASLQRLGSGAGDGNTSCSFIRGVEAPVSFTANSPSQSRSQLHSATRQRGSLVDVLTGGGDRLEPATAVHSGKNTTSPPHPLLSSGGGGEGPLVPSSRQLQQQLQQPSSEPQQRRLSGRRLTLTPLDEGLITSGATSSGSRRPTPTSPSVLAQGMGNATEKDHPSFLLAALDSGDGGGGHRVTDGNGENITTGPGTTLLHDVPFVPPPRRQSVPYSGASLNETVSQPSNSRRRTTGGGFSVTSTHNNTVTTVTSSTARSSDLGPHVTTFLDDPDEDDVISLHHPSSHSQQTTSVPSSVDRRHVVRPALAGGRLFPSPGTQLSGATGGRGGGEDAGGGENRVSLDSVYRFQQQFNGGRRKGRLLL